MNGSIVSVTETRVEQGPHFDRGAIGIDISDLASGPYTYIFIMDKESWKDSFIVK